LVHFGELVVCCDPLPNRPRERDRERERARGRKRKRASERERERAREKKVERSMLERQGRLDLFHRRARCPLFLGVPKQ